MKKIIFFVLLTAFCLNPTIVANAADCAIPTTLSQTEQTETNLVFAEYIKDLNSGLQKQWNVKMGNKSLTGAVKFKLDKTGKLISARIHNSSGSKEFDDKALSLIQNYKFAPFPESAKQETIDVVIVFDYKVRFNGKNIASKEKESVTPDYTQEEGFIAYNDELTKALYANWVIPKGKTQMSATYIFTIGKNGALLSEKMVKSSENKVFDKSTKEAIGKVFPFKPFPQDCKSETNLVRFTFKYEPKTDKKHSFHIEPLGENEKDKAILKKYSKKYENEILSLWQPPARDLNVLVKIKFELDRSGNVISEEIMQSSKNAEIDASAETAVSKTSFLPLPADYSADSAKFVFTFKSDNLTETEIIARRVGWAAYLGHAVLLLLGL